MTTKKARLRARRGFSLIELLVVIAIIAILAAILFPVFSTVRENARQGTCKTNMADIVRAMKLYKDDWGVFPEALYGISYGGPAETRLFVKKYVDNPDHFTCPNVLPSYRRSLTLSPCFDPRTGAPTPWQVPNLDTYTCQPLPTGQRELHYALRWEAQTNALTEDKRQLYRKDPPGNTVVTWCLLHAGMTSAGVPGSGTKAMVAFLDGSARSVDARKMVWSATPKPWQVVP